MVSVLSPVKSPNSAISKEGTLTDMKPLLMSALDTACVTVLSLPTAGVLPQVNTTASPILALAGKATRTLTS